MSTIKLFHDDCFNISPQLEIGSIDLILCDMPYGTTACKWDTVLDLERMWKDLKLIIKDNAAIILFGSEPFSSILRMSNLRNFKYDWVWYKNTASGFLNAKKAPLRAHELISVFYCKQPIYNPQFEEYSDTTKKRFKDGEKINNRKQQHNSTQLVYRSVQRSANEAPIELRRGRYPTNVQKFKVPANSKGRLHPTQKPVALMEYLINTYSNEGDLVLDFCAGSFTTGVACVNLNRDFIGIEKEQNYFEIGRKRIQEAEDAKILR